MLPKIIDVTMNQSTLGNTEISGKYFLLTKKVISGKIKKQIKICQTEIEEKTAKKIEIAKTKIMNSRYLNKKVKVIKKTKEIRILVPKKSKKLKKEASKSVRVKANKTKMINLNHFTIVGFS
jgi:hypothetical protein